jgi:hypothetical protein
LEVRAGDSAKGGGGDVRVAAGASGAGTGGAVAVRSGGGPASSGSVSLFSADGALSAGSGPVKVSTGSCANGGVGPLSLETGERHCPRHALAQLTTPCLGRARRVRSRRRFSRREHHHGCRNLGRIAGRKHLAGCGREHSRRRRGLASSAGSWVAGSSGARRVGAFAGCRRK